MAVTDDVIAKCFEIEEKIDIFRHLIIDAKTTWWATGDADYTDFKSILDPQSDIIVTLTDELQTLVS